MANYIGCRWLQRCSSPWDAMNRARRRFAPTTLGIATTSKERQINALTASARLHAKKAMEN